MRKNGWVLFLFIVLGLLAGALVGEWLAAVPGVSFLTKPITASISPTIDLYVMSFDLSLRFKVSLFSIIGAIIAIWIYRKT